VSHFRVRYSVVLRFSSVYFVPLGPPGFCLIFRGFGSWILFLGISIGLSCFGNFLAFGTLGRIVLISATFYFFVLFFGLLISKIVLVSGIHGSFPCFFFAIMECFVLFFGCPMFIDTFQRLPYFLCWFLRLLDLCFGLFESSVCSFCFLKLPGPSFCF
jgi:hypothetical protein